MSEKDSEEKLKTAQGSPTIQLSTLMSLEIFAT